MSIGDEKLPWVASSETDRSAVTDLVRENPRTLYDARHSAGYVRDLVASGYDACVLAALDWALARYPPGGDVRRILDYGCGQGRFLEELRARYPDAALSGTEISGVAAELAGERVPGAEIHLVEDEALPLADSSADLVLCIEVIEHVRDASSAAAEIARVLRPGGVTIVTAPCANALSAGWVWNAITGGFEPTADGYGRFRTDDPAHLRRLRSAEVRDLLGRAGLTARAARFWGHLGAPIADGLPGLREAPLRLRRWIALLDWRLARRLPSGGAMVMVAER
jgi:SAM-dependent methyltransferase